MSFVRTALPFIALIGVIAAGVLVVSRPDPIDDALAAASPHIGEGGRIVYPARHPPMLTLPDGRREPVLSVLNVRRPLQFGDYAWDDRRVPAGSAWIRIDLAAQTLSVFRAGHEIGSAVILYGTDGKPTPTGVFPIIERAEHHRSTLYDAEMPFMLRLTRDGVAIHASDVREGSATHGCIGIPIQFARLLFAQVRRGDLVAILPPTPNRSPSRG